MNSKTQIEPTLNETDDLNLLDYWRVIRKRARMIIYIFLASVFSTAVISLILTPIYQAKATLMPLESSQNKWSAAMASLQNIPFIGGTVGGSLTKTVTDKFVNILNSRTVAEEVINKLDLTKIIFKEKWNGTKGEWGENPPTLQDTLRVLQTGIVKVTDDRKGLISITVEYQDPVLAANIANAYTAILNNFLNKNSLSLAKRNRIFLENQLRNTKFDLQRAEEDLKSYQTSKKIVSLDAQAEGAVKALAELKAQITIREVQLGAMSEFATKANPEVKRIQDELREFQIQLKRLEKGSNRNRTDDSLGAMITLKDAPSVGLGYARLKRDAILQQKIFELLIQQYELAKIEEAKEELTFQIIDPAVPPEKRIRPKRALNVTIAGMASIFFGVFLVFLLEYIEKQKARQVAQLA